MDIMKKLIAMMVLLFLATRATIEGCDIKAGETVNGVSGHMMMVAHDAESMTLSEYLWNNSVDLREEAVKTIFISGVGAGNLSPDYYANYTLQDAVWLREVAHLWRQLNNTLSAPDIVRAEANRSYYSYLRYSVAMLAAWNIRDDGGSDYGVEMRDAAAYYVGTIKEAMETEPSDMIIVMFPCVSLWPFLARTLLNCTAGQECPNVYKFWMEDNSSNSTAVRFADLIDQLDERGFITSWSHALSLFRQGMLCEINFFNLGRRLAYSAKSGYYAGASLNLG